MWGFLDCTRYYMSFGVPKVVLNEASLAVGTREKLGLLVAPGGGKSTIMRMLAGIDRPNGGQVLRDRGGIPLGYGGAFQPEMTGEENIHNLASLLGLDPLTYSAFCSRFSELGEAYFHPVKMWTGGVRGRLAFAASMGAPAKTFLADGKLLGGDRKFAQKCASALSDRLETAGLIFVASSARATAEFCDRHAVLIDGKIVECGTHEEAAEMFAWNSNENVADEIVDEELASFDLV